MFFTTSLFITLTYFILPVILLPSQHPTLSNNPTPNQCKIEYTSGSSCNGLPCSGPCYSNRSKKSKVLTSTGVDCRLSNDTSPCNNITCINSLKKIECVSYKRIAQEHYNCMDTFSNAYTCSNVFHIMVCDSCALNLPS
ncbi:uncharacterized protein MELLADRAFT_124182 [Melampsora larici-populina 98AG31]|uniref:Secreted protein n=1 Tax=Melampsora larici-populina (strain 98AG31 / pathotype 3-4-7) TaxID=747676 RepID=F4R4X2_MELLP|nr:uncharacterized protein MELLADRAFT_124182 [Melampsora larici-populina 98AG31]EGG12880.1 secreted protein [Melampsora larici-populina 98AG31]